MWGETIKLFIPGQPQGKGRARAFRRGNHVDHYTPDKTRKYEKLVAKTAMSHVAGRPMIEGPVYLAIEAIMEVPHSWPKWKREAAFRGEIMPTGKPDLDNIAKIIKDGLNEVVWKDDAQVCGEGLVKGYGPEPGVNVMITEMPQQAAGSAKRGQ